MKIVKNAILVLSVALVFVSCGSNRQAESAPESFKTLTVNTENISLNTAYSASIRGRQDIKIVPRVDGYLTEILIKEGDRVRQGQTLFVIDQVSFRAALEAAKANVAVCEAGVATAQLTYDSKKALFDKNIVSNFDIVSAENALKTAEAQLAQAKAQETSASNNLSFTVVKSPSNGVAGKIPYRKGDYVGPSTPDGLTVVADNSQMYVYFSMVEKQIMELLQQHKTLESAISQMPEIRLQLSDGTVYEHTGRIESISGVIDHATGTASIRAVFPNAGGLLLSGGAGSVIMPYSSDGVIVIPQEATFEVQDKVYVYKVVDGKATSAIVTVDKVHDGRKYIVKEGLTPGDVIIAEGAGLVQEGTPVQIVENKE